jgi:hypothetical protein
LRGLRDGLDDSCADCVDCLRLNARPLRRATARRMRTRALNSADVSRSLRRLDRKREGLSPRTLLAVPGSRPPAIPRARSRKVYSSRYRQKFLSDCEGFLRCGVFGVLRTVSVVCKTLPHHAVLRAAAVDAHRSITRCTFDALRLVLGAVSRSPKERPVADRDGDRDQVDGLERVGPWPGLAANWPISS